MPLLLPVSYSCVKYKSSDIFFLTFLFCKPIPPSNNNYPVGEKNITFYKIELILAYSGNRAYV